MSKHWKTKEDMSEHERALSDAIDELVPQEEITDIHVFGEIGYGMALEASRETIQSAMLLGKMDLPSLLFTAAMGAMYHYRSLLCEISPQTVDQIDRLLVERYKDSEE